MSIWCGFERSRRTAELRAGRLGGGGGRAGGTALHYAAADDSLHVNVCLLDAGADGELKNRLGYTPMQAAGAWRRGGEGRGDGDRGHGVEGERGQSMDSA